VTPNIFDFDAGREARTLKRLVDKGYADHIRSLVFAEFIKLFLMYRELEQMQTQTPSHISRVLGVWQKSFGCTYVS
jgi:hypothetical protein